MKTAARLLGLVFWLLVPGTALAAFGLTTTADYYSVDTGAGLVFKVRRTDNNSNTQSAGDIMSLYYNGVEYQDQTRGTQINSGFDYLYAGISTVTVSAAVVNTKYIVVTVVAGNLTHYYMARSGDANIYMATYFTTEPDTLGLCRFIVRIPNALLPNGPTPSNILNNTGAIESADIFGMADGTTRSKHYSNMRLHDWSYIGATGTNVGIWIVRDNHEGDSGGPFYRSLLNQCGSDQEITYILNYGESQTEAYRTSILNGPYTLVFTTGAPPTALDTSWVASMGLTGYVPASGRGSVTGTAITGRDTSYAYTVGFSNTAAQYWTDAAPGDGSFTMANMIPGTYTMNVYKNELAVATLANVSVTAGTTTPVGSTAITADPSQTVALWRIGNWDGSPGELLNGSLITYMHPSDVRMSAWSPGTYAVGTSMPGNGMPCYQWKDVNGGQAIQFTLTAAQVAASTVRVGITTAYAGGRPNITINSTTTALQSAATEPNTRSLTVGSYRGNNTTYNFSVPASVLVAGTNTLTVYPISGSSGTGYLSPGYSLDCVDLIQGGQTLAPPAAPASLTAAFGNAQVSLSWPAVSGAASYTVLRATASGGVYTAIASGVTSTTYTNTGLTNFTTYYYVVTASNGSGAGVFSPEASATPSTLPMPPASLAATFADGSDTLTWAASNTATSYHLKRSRASGSGYVTIQNLTSLTYTDTGLSNGTTYYYVVFAVNASGEGTNSAEVAVTPNVILTLTCVSVAAQDGYLAESRQGSSVGGTATATGLMRTGNDFTGRRYRAILSFDTSTLPDDTTVLYATLQMRRAGGSGTNPFTVSGTCYADIKGGTGFGGSTTLSTTDFQAAADATQVATMSNAASTGSWSAGMVGTEALPYINLTGTTQFRIYFPAEYNANNTSNFITWNAGDDTTLSYRPQLVLTYIKLAIPAVPVNVSGTVDNSQITLHWAASTRATSYTVSRANASGGPYDFLAKVSTPTYTDKGLTNGTTYYYVISASDSTGTSANSPEASARPAQNFAQWVAAAFPGQTDSLTIGPLADPDHDGCPNLLEYFHGTGPGISDAASTLTATLDGAGHTVLIFRMSKNVVVVTYSIEQSADLLSWTDTGISSSIMSDQGSYYLMKAIVPLNAQTPGFLRLVISGP